MDIILEKIDYFNNELDNSIHKVYGEDYSLKNTLWSTYSLIAIEIYNLIKSDPILNAHYTRRAFYYYNLLANSDYLKTIYTLIEIIKSTYKPLNVNKIDTFIKEECDFAKISDYIKENIENIFSDKDLPLLVDMHYFVNLISDPNSYIKLNPNVVNTARVINQFQESYVFNLLDQLFNTIEDSHEELYPNGYYLSTRQNYREHFSKLNEYLVNRPIAENIKSFDIFDKFVYVTSYPSMSIDIEKYENCTAFVNDSIKIRGITHYAKDVLRILRWDYLENINKDNKLDIESKMDRYSLTTLTPTEKKVLSLILEGMQNKQIANDLNIAISTVEKHVNKILEKTNCSDRKDLIITYRS